jgi:hypothetical protein
MRVHLRLQAGGTGEAAQAAGGRVAVHPGAAGVEQDRPAGSQAGCPVTSPANGGRQRDQDHLGALSADPQDPVAVLLAEVAYVGAGGFEDPQAEQAEHGYQREIVPVR